MAVDFEEKWKRVLEEAEKKLVEELLGESEKIIDSIETQIQLEIKDKNPLKLKRNHAEIKYRLEQRKSKKWQTFRERNRGSLTTKINNRYQKAVQ